MVDSISRDEMDYRNKYKIRQVGSECQKLTNKDNNNGHLGQRSTDKLNQLDVK